MGTVVAAGQRFAAIADMQVGDGNQSAAVGDSCALGTWIAGYVSYSQAFIRCYEVRI